MNNPITRRKLLQAGAAASASVLIGPAAMARTYSANEKIRFALVGIGGMGGKGVGVASGEQIIAAADVDFNHAAGSIKNIKGRFPDAKIYSDYRKLFDEQKHLDAVWVATPDHSHFPASVRALDAGLALYCEKPLCHDIYEARKLRELAKAKKVATQMGNQGHSGEHVRLLCEWIWQGSLGDVTEAHVRPPYNQMDFGSRDAGQPAPVPASLDWDLWQGPVKAARVPQRHPSGRMARLDRLRHGPAGRLVLPQRRRRGVGPEALRGRHVRSRVRGRRAQRARTGRTASASPGSSPSAATWSPASCGGVRARTTTSRCPPRSIPERVAAVAKHPSAYFGTKGTAVSGWWMNDVRLFPESFMQQVGKPKAVLPRVKGHEADFLNAIRTGGRSSADFDYSARLTEIMLVGNVASLRPREAQLRLPRGQVHQQRQGQRPAEAHAAQGVGIRLRIAA